MPNGKPGDHPISDAAIHKLPVYGEPTDSQLRRIVQLLGYQRAYEWFTPLWSVPHAEHPSAIAAKLAELQRHAEVSGWERDTTP